LAANAALTLPCLEFWAHRGQHRDIWAIFGRAFAAGLAALHADLGRGNVHLQLIVTRAVEVRARAPPAYPDVT